jgi:hypothetical protein
MKNISVERESEFLIGLINSGCDIEQVMSGFRTFTQKERRITICRR